MKMSKPTGPISQNPNGIGQVASGITFILQSSLLRWNNNAGRFEPVDSDLFEVKAIEMHKKFGRVMKWVLFSTGAEHLLKGILILNGQLTIEEEEKLKVLDAYDKPEWIDIALMNKKLRPESHIQMVPQYSTMGHVFSDLEKLCAEKEQAVGNDNLSPKDSRHTRAAIRLLYESIRNRDSHGYVEDVRRAHWQVIKEFCPAFNRMLSWINSDDWGKIMLLAEPQNHLNLKPEAD